MAQGTQHRQDVKIPPQFLRINRLVLRVAGQARLLHVQRIAGQLVAGLYEHHKRVRSDGAVRSSPALRLRDDVPDRTGPPPRLQIRCDLPQEAHSARQEQLHRLVATHLGDRFLHLHHHQHRYPSLYPAYMTYTRNVFPQYQAKIFFLFITIFFAIKYFLLAQYTTSDNVMSKRNEIKTNDVLMGRRQELFANIPE